jgi:hypothetical protein
MAEAASVKRQHPEYHAWLIKHANKAMLIIVLVSFLWLYIAAAVFENPNSSGFTLLAISVISTLPTPILCAMFPIILMRWYGAQEMTIKITAMVVFFVVFALGVFSIRLSESNVLSGDASYFGRKV